MRTADVWEPPEDSTIGAVASRIIKDMNYRPPNLFHFDADSARRGRERAGKTATARAQERRAARRSP